MATKKQTKHDRAWAATAAMPTPSGSCDGTTCTNPPAVAIGELRLCAECLEKVRKAYPNSFERYWAGKVERLPERGA
jgi:hypothetical protein